MAINTNEIPTAFEESFDMAKFDPRKIEWTHVVARTQLYPDVQDQLDMLFKDIDAGLFGEQAKTGQFYQMIKQVKETHPKGETYKPYAHLPGPDGTYD